MNTFAWPRFYALPVVGILRGFERRLLPGIIASSIAGGLTTIEVTMNSANAADQIREAAQLAGGRLNIGAGTVLNLDLLDEALAAGASFIVTPGLQEPVVRACVQESVPIFPGAFSPTEILRAANLQATWVKLFPAEALGASYIKRIKQALPHVHLLPTGGVTLTTLPHYLGAGADGIGIGSPLFAPERILAEDWIWLEDRCRALVELYQSCRPLAVPSGTGEVGP